MSKPIVITDDEFQREVLDSGLPVLVDFWAQWCAPCRRIAPVVEELAGEYEGRVKVCKLDVDSNPKTPSKYGIRSIPTLMIFKDGKVIDHIVGAVPKQHLVSRLEAAL
ncbi:MAG TPA: thioredoxin [Candidatus Latescibacteria bacterium]|nr:thioredoxin [Candidatus Latescibacterota bacterium]